MSIIWFKRALRASGVWFVSTREKIFVPCPCWQHNNSKTGVISIYKRTQKGDCKDCGLQIDSYTDLAARLDLIKSPKEFAQLIHRQYA